MQLYVDANYLSPYAMTAFVALREKGIPFELLLISLNEAQQFTPAYAGISATKRVPCLVDGQLHLSESSAICEYLEDLYPATAIYPGNVQHKAKAREVQAWLRSDLVPIREERSTEVVFLKRAPPPLSTAAKMASNKLFSAVEQWLQTGEQHLFGHWSIVDTDLALMLNRLLLAGDAVPERLAHYARFQWQRPSVQEWVKMTRPIQ